MKENEIVVSVKEWNRLLKEADYWRTMYEGCKKRLAEAKIQAGDEK